MSKVAYTIREACAATGLGRTRLYEEISLGKFDARKLGAKTVITAKSLQEYVTALPLANIKLARRPSNSGDRKGERTSGRGQLTAEATADAPPRSAREAR